MDWEKDQPIVAARKAKYRCMLLTSLLNISERIFEELNERFEVLVKVKSMIQCHRTDVQFQNLLENRFINIRAYLVLKIG